MLMLHIMWTDHMQQQHYYKGYINTMSQHGSQAIRIHAYPVRYYKRKCTSVHNIVGWLELV